MGDFVLDGCRMAGNWREKGSSVAAKDGGNDVVVDGSAVGATAPLDFDGVGRHLRLRCWASLPKVY